MKYRRLQIMALGISAVGASSMVPPSMHDHEIVLPREPKAPFQVEPVLPEAEHREAEPRRADDLPARFLEITAERRPLLNAKGGLSVNRARQVQEFLNQNFSRKLSLAEMAAVCGLSPYHFVRAFSKTFGVPPHQYVLGLRLDFAEKLLVDRRMSITDIADLSGFSSQSHFTTTMKKYRNTTPRQVRARQGRSQASE
ncbi:AraC family transcriptional regulator [Mesorhizobium sp. WSM4906]|uniref:AraC family transcriptional regulator n=1 Tax=Mesorhizobium sp. WSM4906 TaxID=3038546 RepID=UPI002416C628|nr:AraC family transcriptional regulator [Mesorhizobium sp. WSM4906]WFP75396.1 AraC family transcriptional regulator [Mesorhizobium sp. WSM4906]